MCQADQERAREREALAEIIAAADLRDLALVVTRAATDNGKRIPLDDVLAALGHTRGSLMALPDDE